MIDVMLSKAEIRSRVLARRDRSSLSDRLRHDAVIAHHVIGLAAFKEAETVLLFASFRSEVGTAALIDAALAGGKTVSLPVVRPGGRLDLYRITSREELQPGYMGIPEPPALEDREIRPDEVGLVAVPGAAFDRRGYRVGYGGGYYDRLLPQLAPGVLRIGLAYGLQIMDAVPTEDHDERVDRLVTEEGVIPCAKS